MCYSRRMPTVFSHAAIGFVAAKFANEVSPSNARIVLASMALSAFPDADALFINVIPYNHPFGHRGFTHSLLFATIIGLAAAFVFSKLGWSPQHQFWFLALPFALVTASHGFFDAMTDGGLGVAFFAPFTNHRYFFPWRPIPVAPLSFAGLMTARGLHIFQTEAALFAPFTVGAAIWNRQTKTRMALSVVCAAIGTVMWIIALNR